MEGLLHDFVGEGGDLAANDDGAGFVADFTPVIGTLSLFDIPNIPASAAL